MSDIDVSKLSGTTMHLRLPDGNILVWLSVDGEVYDYANPEHAQEPVRKNRVMLCNQAGEVYLGAKKIELDDVDYTDENAWDYTIHNGWAPGCSVKVKQVGFHKKQKIDDEKVKPRYTTIVVPYDIGGEGRPEKPLKPSEVVCPTCDPEIKTFTTSAKMCVKAVEKTFACSRCAKFFTTTTVLRHAAERNASGKALNDSAGFAHVTHAYLNERPALPEQPEQDES